MKLKIPEREIQKTILGYLKYKKIYCVRVGSGAIKFDNRYFKSGSVGCPDIICCLPPNGRFIGFEVKSSTGKPNASQIKAGEEIKASGGVYAVVRSVEDVEKVLNQCSASNFNSCI